MSSNDRINSDENVLKRLPAVELQEELRNLVSFGRLMDLFLSRNILEWGQQDDSLLLYNLNVCGELEGEFLQLKKSILVLAYLFRRKFWKMFRDNSQHLQPGGAEKYVLFLSIPNRYYMFHFLVHLACLYEMVTFGYTKGENYSGRAMSDLTASIDPRALLCFVKQGGFQKLYRAAYNINAFYDAFLISFNTRFPNIDILTPFVRAVNIMEKRLRSIEWNKELENKKNSEDDPKYKRKLQALLSLELHGYRIGYVSVNKNQSRDEDNTSNTSSQTMHTSIVDDSFSTTLDETDLEGNDEILAPSNFSDRHMDTAQNEATNTAESPVFPYETLLIVSENFCKKYISSNKGELELNCKKDIKIYCPETKTEVSIFSMKTFDDNIRKCKWGKVRKGMYMFDIEYFVKLDNDEIIMDTSSEEEDELEDDQENIKRQAMDFFRDLGSYQMRVMKLLLKKYTKKNLFKFLYTLLPNEESAGAVPEVKTPIQRKIGSSANGTTATKANTPIQRKPGNGSNGTGAIPKAKTPIQRKSGSSADDTTAISKANTPIPRKPGSSENDTGAIPKVKTPFPWMLESSANDQNTPISSHSSNSYMTSLRRISRRGSWHTPNGKRDYRKKPVKRNLIAAPFV